MSRGRIIAAGMAGALLLSAGGYVTADIYDVVPGVLTLDEPVDPDTLPNPAPEGGPEPEVPGLVQIPVAAGRVERGSVPTTAPTPDPAALAAAVETQLAAPGFFGSAAVVIADGVTGAVLYERDAQRPVTPASTQKLISGAGVLLTLDPDDRLTTSAVRTGADTIALVAGGDTMLARDHGDPQAVEGRAGIADLAEQVVESLAEEGTLPHQVTVSVDMSYAAGPRYAPNWNMEDIALGYNQGVTMIGLAGQRPRPFHPSPPEPEKEAVAAFVAALATAGLPAQVAADPVLTTPVAGSVLGEVHSATIAELTTFAMDLSENALTENLARQASAAVGGPADFQGVADFLLKTVAELGIDTSGARMMDASGMSYDQKMPARLISDLISAGTTGAEPRLQPLVAGLPVAGLSGTLRDRYRATSTSGVAGIPRAKTGTINQTIALAGTTTTRDGRLLTFVAIADKVPREGRLEAQLALDRLTTALTECGCR